MAETTKEPGPIMKFIQDYRMKMLIPELLVVFGVWYILPSSLTSNVYEFLGPFMYIMQPIAVIPSGIMCFITAFTLHGIYPLDNYHEGKISKLPKTAVVMIAVSFVLLPVLVLFQMIGYFMTEATEYFSRNPLWERFESFGDLFFYAGAMFFVGLQWWLFIPVFLLAQGVDGIHKIAHHETSSEKITWVFYFIWVISFPLFFNPVEIIALAVVSIPAFAFYSYIRPYYTYVTATQTIAFALLVLATLLIVLAFGDILPLMNQISPGFIPDHTPIKPGWWPIPGGG